MLKEIDLDDIPERKLWGSAPTETSMFCEATLKAFMDSTIKTAEVEGWPKGKPQNCKQATSYLSSMSSKIKHMKLENVSCITRGRRIFLMKTIIRKEVITHE